jgi:hypothetical protein
VIAHIVLFEPRAQFDEATRAAFLEKIAVAANEIPTIRRFHVGRRVTHGMPGYEQAMTTVFGYAAVIEFDDKAGLTAYLRHPAHAALGEFFTTAAARALAYDFDMLEARGLSPSDLL